MENVYKNENLFNEFDEINKDDPRNFISWWWLREKIINDGWYMTFSLLLACIENKHGILEEEREYTQEELIEMKEKAVDLALEYIYPLLKEWRLKAKLLIFDISFYKEGKKDKFLTREYYKDKVITKKYKYLWKVDRKPQYELLEENLEEINGADIAMKEIREEWQKVKELGKSKELKDRIIIIRDFELDNVFITLPENEWWDGK